MDAGIDEDVIVESIQYMQSNNLYSIEDINLEDDLPEQVREGIEEDAGDLNAYFLDESVMDKITKDYLLIGGAKNECLEEVRLFLKSQGKREEVNEKLVYDGDYGPVRTNKSRYNLDW